jgi:lysyl-tRNA synthetase class 2
MHPSAFKELQPDNLVAWSKFINKIREFFHLKQVLEVTTPLLAQTSVTDPNINSVKCTLSNQVGYLQTSPEYAMKRLLSAGSGCIYQICPAFRDDLYSPIHRAEFTMLEWYRLDYDYKNLMGEVVELLGKILPEIKVEYASYNHLFDIHLGVDIISSSTDVLAKLLRDNTNNNFDFVARDDYLDALFSLVIQPKLKNTAALFVYDFPPEQAALSKVSNQVAERFELYINGIEIANGYSELTDVNILKERFLYNNEIRLAKGLPAMDIDLDFVAAMSAGLPKCAGVAIGLERLFMHVVGKDSI